MDSKNNTLDIKAKNALMDSFVSQHPILLLAFVLTGVILVLSLWESQHQPTLLLWFAVNVAATGTMLVFVYFYKKDSARFTYRTWLFTFCSLVAFMGTAWGLAFLLFIDPHSFYTLFIISTLSLGIISGALYTDSLLPPAFHAFFSPNVAMYIFSIYGDEQLFGALLAVSVFAIMMAFVSINIYRLSFNSLKNQYEKDELSQSLQLEKERVEKASRAKTRFLAAASHDLRQPLQAQRLFADAIMVQSHDSHLQTLAEKLLASQKSMQSMLDSLLDISRLDAATVKPNPSRASLFTIFSVLEQEFEPIAQQKGLSLYIHWPQQQIKVDVDRGLLDSILRNLLSNAIRYTNHGGVMLAVRKRGDSWQLEVRDSGIGIEEDKQHEIFEEFCQLDNPERDRSLGLGLGLSIVQRLCVLLDYPLHLNSKVGKGSVFSFRIPRLHDEQGQTHAPDSKQLPLQPSKLKGKHVLIIDDDKDIREGLVHALTSYGLCVAEAANSENVNLCLKIQQPDIIISDFRLANAQTGTQLIKSVRRQTGIHIPAIIITGNTSPEQLPMFDALKDTVLHKPVTTEQLLTQMQKLLLN